MRLVGQDLPVFERARLGLVGVADRVLHAARFRAADQAPLLPGGEPGATHPAQPGVLERGHHPVGGQLTAEQRPQRRIPLTHTGAGRVGVVRPGLGAPRGRGLGVAHPAVPSGGTPARRCPRPRTGYSFTAAAGAMSQRPRQDTSTNSTSVSAP